MNIEELRDYCLSMADVTEKMPFTRFHGANSILVFYVHGKTFCYVDIDKFDSCLIKGNPETISQMKERFACVQNPQHFQAKHWMQIRLNEDMDDGTLKELIRTSYEIVCSETQKKRKQELLS
ncbi:MAG: MmcQ/YjbR family DNA-binding protein [Prevotella sp.]|nr:MmcQ/YjbR family DNA-binding protein [Prevotella sp.]